MTMKDNLITAITGLLHYLFINLKANKNHVIMVDACKLFKIGNTQFMRAAKDQGILIKEGHGHNCQWIWNAGEVTPEMIDGVAENMLEQNRIRAEERRLAKEAETPDPAPQEPLPLAHVEVSEDDAELLQVQILDALRTNNVLLEQILKRLQFNGYMPRDRLPWESITPPLKLSETFLADNAV